MSLNDKYIHSRRGGGWKYDLPGPNEPPTSTPDADALPYTPNILDDVLMDLPRCTLQNRGVGAWLFVCFVPFAIGIMAIWIYSFLVFKRSPEAPDAALVGSLVVTWWIFIYMWRMDTEAPVDEPIRFNRARRKVYVYHFRHNGRKILSRTDWGVYPQSYDWDNIRAEFCSLYSPLGAGGLIQFVTLTVYDSNTGQALDRFPFAHGKQQGETYWAMARLFMQQGRQAIPIFEQPPRDWNNETHFENIARRLAPKVQWPAQMDLESRTAPEVDCDLSPAPGPGAGGR